MNASALRKVYVTLMFLSSICLVDNFFYTLATPVYIWAGAFLIIDIFTKQKLLTIRYKQLIFAFIISSTFTAIINISSNFLNNIGFIYQNIVCFFLFYGMHTYSTYSEIKKELLSLFSFLLNLTTIFVTSSLILLLIIKDGFTMMNYDFCIKDNRLVGVFINANLLAFYCVFAIILCHILYTNKKNSVKGLNKTNYIYFISLLTINLFALFLTDSNGSMLLLITYCCVYLIQYITSKSIRLSKKVVLKRFIILIISLILIISGIIVLRSGLQQGISELFTSTGNLFNHLNTNIDSGRLDLYTQGIALFMKAPIFGIGKANINTFADILFGGLRFSDLHNGYLTLLVSVGLIGFNIFLIFIYILLKNMLKYMFNDRQSEFPCIISFIIAYLLYSFIEITLIYNISYSTTVFWFALGYATSYVIKYDKLTIKTSKIKN